MINNILKNLDYGKISVMIPILLIIFAVSVESFKDYVPLEMRQRYGVWVVTIISIVAILASLTSMFLAICSFFKKQSIVFGIIGILLDLPVLAFFGWLLAVIILVEMIIRSPSITPKLH
jgi:hypothetical protein